MKKSKQNTSTSEATENQFATIAREYAVKRIQSLLKNIERSRTYYSVEGIHDLRVEVKKLRALFDLVQKIVPSFDAEKQRRPLRKLFKRAGQLRDIDIEQALVLKQLGSCDVSEFYNRLKEQELLLRPGFADACDTFEPAKLQDSLREIEKAFAGQSIKVTANRVRRDILNVLHRIDTLAGREHQTEHSLHELRKMVKRARYTLDIWKPLLKSQRPVKRIASNLKAISDHLGEWHDAEVLLESIRLYLEHDAPRAFFDDTAYPRFMSHLKHRSKRKLEQYDTAKKKLDTMGAPHVLSMYGT